MYANSIQQSNTAQINLPGHQLVYLKDPKPSRSYSEDIISGVYEGGFKIWECEIDLLKYLSQGEVNFLGKSVLQIGCGHGLLGILALKLGASSVCLQDYNEDVIQEVTRATVQLNVKEEKERIKFMFGDWQTIIQQNVHFDIILGSELIYNESNYMKIARLLNKFLAPQGVAVLANKHYYFGVGGNMPAFKQCLDQHRFSHATLLKIQPTTGGNKKQILRISHQT